MSSTVSDQMKAPGNTAKSVDEQNIPWSQQVDEAAYESLPSPAKDDNTCAQPSSMQFQYPPFNAKESQNVGWNNQKSKKPNNYDSNKKYGKQTTYGNTKKDEFQANPWGMQKRGKPLNDNPSNNNSNRSIRVENAWGKTDSKEIMNISSDDKKLTAPTQSAAPKKTTWASIASQPAKMTSRTNLTTLSHKKKGPGMPPPPMVPGKHNLDVNAWDTPNNNPPPVPSPPPPADKLFTEIDPNYSVGIGCDYDIDINADRNNKKNQHFRDENKYNTNNSNYGRTRTSPVANSRKNWSMQSFDQNREPGNTNSGHIRRAENSAGNIGNQNRRNNYARADTEFSSHDARGPSVEQQSSNVEDLAPEASNAVLEKLYDRNNYNPVEMDLSIAAAARFFVIKSYSEDDIHRSIKYEIWCSTDHGNKRLDDAFKERQKEGGEILLFFSVNGSGHFCGMAQMMTAVDYNSTSSVWSQDKWKGKFKVKWIYVKDVPNTKLRHIRLENNENKSVTNSRDTQEVPNAKGIEVLQVIHCYKHCTSIFDDFYHYEKKQEEEVSRKPNTYDNMPGTAPASRHFGGRQPDERERDRDNRGGIGGPQKYFPGGNTNFRERKNSYRSNFHNNYNDQRRDEGHKMNSVPISHQKERNSRTDADTARDNNDYVNRQKFDYSQRPKQYREHDVNDKDARFRSITKETLKDKDY